MLPQRKDKLCQELSECFNKFNNASLQKNGGVHHSYDITQRFYPFSNEYDFNLTLEKMDALKPHQTSKLRIAILTGESNILSILPELSQHADLVICNDIDYRVHEHISYMRQCMMKADSRSQFNELYFDGTPLLPARNFNRQLIQRDLDYYAERLGERYFLYSDQRFVNAKSVLAQLNFAYTNIDMFDVEQVSLLVNFMKDKNACVTLLNVTNLHEYNSENRLQNTIEMLFADNPDPILLYSTSLLQSQFTTQLAAYFEFMKKNPPIMLRPSMTFFNPPDRKSPPGNLGKEHRCTLL
ncbi:hypothetical protein [Aquicella lusitana]|uniref:Uncharacterized protein n=1 Tax=Aquicella lusitana TaxID=254246 RepID=A0A370GZV5_9COXI|nr:hypothetical protein [Aquicella lusitana]RDI48847.1 hypothetical protein C8D86_101130 [Aquicella lusitana]VVC73275.1 hypothetical protein AQULUS_10100 [Aquicella lusitana]